MRARIIASCLVTAALATVVSGPEADAACQNAPAPTSMTRFEAGSLILDTYGESCAAVEPFALAYYLLTHGIRFSWILKNNKVDINEDDIPPIAVEKYSWATSYNTFAASPAQSFKTGPLVIPASHAEAALRLIYEGVAPWNSNIRFGWKVLSGADCSNSSAADVCNVRFTAVSLYRATAAFDAPVYRTVSAPPMRVAVWADNTSFFANMFEKQAAQMDFFRAKGSPSNPGHVWDALGDADVASSTILNTGNYSMLLIGDDKAVINDVARANIQAFVAAGGQLVAHGKSTQALDSVDATRYMSTIALSEAAPDNNPVLLTPASPWSQIKGSYESFASAPRAFNLGGGWKDCVRLSVRDGGGYSYIFREDTNVGGYVGYFGGNGAYGNNCNDAKKANWQRTVLNLMLGTGKPYAGEFTRSSPTVVDNLVNGSLAAFQGSMEMPWASENISFNTTEWVFPAARGHLRAFDVATSCDLTALNTFPAMWDASLPADPASRRIYTAKASGGGLERVPFTAASLLTDLNLQSDLQVGANAGLLISGVRSGALGGVDRSTPAYIGTGENITFAGAYKRPVVAYVAGLDGMLHAFEVPDLENTTTYDWASARELWAFIPRNQLKHLWNNDQALQPSPAIADIYGPVVEQDGTPSARLVTPDPYHREWATVLAMSSHGADGRGSLTMIDITNPDPDATECPTQWSGFSACVKGPNPLWSRSNDGVKPMGRATGSAMGVVLVPDKRFKAAVFVTTDIPGVTSDTGGGVRLFAFDAATGENLWPATKSLEFRHRRAKHGMVSTANEPPAPPVLVDISGGAYGYQTDILFPDYDGKIWRITNLENDPPTVSCVWDAVQAGVCNSLTSVAGVWQTNDPAGQKAIRPIAAPLTVYFRESPDEIHVLFGTGGTYWSPTNATNFQIVQDLNITASPVAGTLLYSFNAADKGFYRVYAPPIMVNEDIYVVASEGLPDVLPQWKSGARGSVLRFTSKFDTDTSKYVITSTVLVDKAVGYTSASALGVSRDNTKLLVTAVDKAGVLTPAAGSGAGTTAPNKQGKGQDREVKVQIWSPSLR